MPICIMEHSDLVDATNIEADLGFNPPETRKRREMSSCRFTVRDTKGMKYND